MTISALYCLKNEAEFIERSLAAVVPYVNEVVLFDTGSTDGTVEIAKKFIIRTRLSSAPHPNIKLIEHPLDYDHGGGEYSIRNLALSHCTKNWVLALDADQVMSDGWRDAVSTLMLDHSAECIGANYEHLVGSYEYVHRPECGVPDITWVLFRRTLHLHWRPAAEVCAWAKPEHHASAERSCRPGSLRICRGATVFHYGFTKQNMMEMAIYRVGRGDSGHEPEKKQQLVQQLQSSGNPFLFCGPVCRVKYSREQVPAVMRAAFDNTYKLNLDADGKIISRVNL